MPTLVTVALSPITPLLSIPIIIKQGLAFLRWAELCSLEAAGDAQDLLPVTNMKPCPQRVLVFTNLELHSTGGELLRHSKMPQLCHA